MPKPRTHPCVYACGRLARGPDRACCVYCRTTHEDARHRLQAMHTDNCTVHQPDYRPPRDASPKGAYTVRIEQDLWAWAASQPGGAPALIRRLLQIARHCQPRV